jgi:hypothetical protein
MTPPQSRARFLLSALGLAAVLVIAHVAASDGYAYDAHAYWLARPYDLPVGAPDAVLYAPPVVLAFRALSILPWPAFLEAWSLVIGVGMWALAGPFTLLVLLLPWVTGDLIYGNIHVLLALAIVAGFRWPGTWAFVLLTKVTPGIGLLWFVVRREWRQLGIALGVTAAIALPTMVLAPDLWVAWIRLLLASGSAPTVIGGPLWLRLPVAGAIVILGARRDWRWTVPLAAMIALPVVWEIAPAMLLGSLYLARRPQRGKPSIVQVSQASAPSATAGEWSSAIRQ